MSSGTKRNRSTFEGPSTQEEDDKWSEELHRNFVQAIYDAGLAQSSPSVILECMMDPPVSLTSERVKSHLQKYRKNKEKSRADFMQDYDAFLRKLQTVSIPRSAMMEMLGCPAGGEIAAHLTYTVIMEGREAQSQKAFLNMDGARLQMPRLTEEEKRSPVGMGLEYLRGLCVSFTQQIMEQRKKQKTEANEKQGEEKTKATALVEDTAKAGAAKASSSGLDKSAVTEALVDSAAAATNGYHNTTTSAESTAHGFKTQVATFPTSAQGMNGLRFHALQNGDSNETSSGSSSSSNHLMPPPPEFFPPR